MSDYSQLKIHSLNAESTWIDKDIIMLHACFQLLVDCVEKEDLLIGYTDWNFDKKTQDIFQEITFLYQWWIERRDSDKNELLDSNQYDIDNEMLIRLINVRKSLWT